jgi:endonuclease/exonuclease/phosphatase family metal-dependent hydrolase
MSRPTRSHLTAVLTIAVAAAVPASAARAEAERVRVMTFNLWAGGDAGKQPLEKSVEVIKAAGADLVGLQETAGSAEKDPPPDNARKIAAALGWHYLDQGARTGVISRFPIVAPTPGKWGVTVELPSKRKVHLFNVHLAHAPYQPYQLLKIPYEGAPFLTTAEEAVEAARKSRGEQIRRALDEVGDAAMDGNPLFLTGDFNEPSHLDWTEAAAKAKRCPLPVAWPTSRAVTDEGFVDVFRHLRTDEVKDRGDTWTPTTRRDDPKDRHDRIDFVYARGKGLKYAEARVVGEDKERADVVVKPYPSDHRAVVVTVELPPVK